jgi:hypothetical protein
VSELHQWSSWQALIQQRLHSGLLLSYVCLGVPQCLQLRTSALQLHLQQPAIRAQLHDFAFCDRKFLAPLNGQIPAYVRPARVLVAVLLQLGL